MNSILLPYRFKWPGIALVATGLCGFVIFIFFDLELMIPVFAVFSSFLETKMFVTFRTNVADELIMLSFLTGFFLICFSKEKAESEKMGLLRLKAAIRAVKVNTGLLVFSIIFVFGNGFLYILLFNLFSGFIFYLVFFEFFKYKASKSQ